MRKEIGMEKNNIWEQPDRVEHFASKVPDNRLLEFLRRYPEPGKIKVLDLGCAGGRNAILMAEQGFDLWAVDSSEAMIAKTRELLKNIWDEEKISSRILTGSMDHLSFFDDAFFDLIVALGIYHNAQSESEFFRSLDESRRILKPGGHIIVANFAPGTNFGDLDLSKDPSSQFIWKGAQAGNLCLLTAEELDDQFKRRGFVPIEKSATVHKKLERGQRVTINALYIKKGTS